jgi:hypothetical protein
MSFSSSRMLHLGLAGSYATALLVNYIYIVAPNFSYRGYLYDARAIDLAAAMVIALLPIAWFPAQVNRPSVMV